MAWQPWWSSLSTSSSFAPCSRMRTCTGQTCTGKKSLLNLKSHLKRTARACLEQRQQEDYVCPEPKKVQPYIFRCFALLALRNVVRAGLSLAVLYSTRWMHAVKAIATGLHEVKHSSVSIHRQELRKYLTKAFAPDQH